MKLSNTNNRTRNFLNICLFAFVFLLGACAKEEQISPLEPEPQQKAVTTTYKNGGQDASISVVASNDSERLFEDTESLTEMTAENRRFKISEIIRLRAVSKDSIEITNFAPIDITGFTITMESAGHKVDLLKVSKLSAHTSKIIFCPLGISPDQAVLGYEGTTPLIQKLKRLQDISWQIKPHNFNNANAGWKVTPSARDFRMMTGMMINAAYMMMDSNLLPQLEADVVFKDDGKTLLNAEEKRADMQRMKSINRIDVGVLGVNSNAVGLAGIGVYGLSAKLYQESYSWASTVLGHEFAHMLGYNHDSNMTYPQVINGRSQGFGVLFQQLWNKALQADKLLINQKEYYMLEDLD